LTFKFQLNACLVISSSVLFEVESLVKALLYRYLLIRK